MRVSKSHAKQQDRDWIIANHDRINGYHEQLIEDGFVFVPGKVRLWRCKDGSVSIRLVYEKIHASYSEEQAVLMRLRGSEGRAFLGIRELKLSWKGKL